MDAVSAALGELCDITECRCDRAWTDRDLHHPRCVSDYRADVQTLQARIEDLEEALRRMVVVCQPDGRHVECVREQAALAIALDQLNLDAL
jgi:hypothetical protein